MGPSELGACASAPARVVRQTGSCCAVPCDRLKGHFSRIDHQMSSFYTKDNSHVLNSLVMHLPAGAKDAY